MKITHGKQYEVNTTFGELKNLDVFRFLAIDAAMKVWMTGDNGGSYAVLLKAGIIIPMDKNDKVTKLNAELVIHS